MMSSNKYKEKLIATYKSISGNKNDHPEYIKINSKTAEEKINRGIFDEQALLSAYSNKHIYHSFQPDNTEEKELYKKLEEIRVQKKALDIYPGAISNINKMIKYHFKNKIKTSINISKEFLFLYTREKIISKTLDLTTFKQNAKNITLIDRHINSLISKINDQQKYAQESLNILKLITIQTNTKKEKKTQNNKSNKNEQNNKKSSYNSETEKSEKKVINKDTDNKKDKLTSNKKKALNYEDETLISIDNKFNSSNYNIYTKQYDKILNVKDTIDKNELKKLNEKLNKNTIKYKPLIKSLANKLQRKLQALQKRHWEYNLEEGVLNANKLAEIVINPLSNLSFKKEKEIKFKDTVVSLLVDNSGSMRGKPINIASISTNIIIQALEKCNIKTEVLGFTTKNWQGGDSKTKWQKDGKIKNPGRLNDTLHIIYKSSSCNFKNSKNNISYMIKDGLLKENIDGEALLWAYSRLLQKTEERKILIVLSDGAPVDDSTILRNENDILTKHLKDVVSSIENNKQIELSAIGICHDVNEYYKNSITIYNLEELPNIMTKKLLNLFKKV